MRQQSIGRCAVADRKDRGDLRAVNAALNARKAKQPGSISYSEWMNKSVAKDSAKKAAQQRERAKLNTTAGMFGSTVKPNAS